MGRGRRAQRPGSWRFCLGQRWLLRVGQQIRPQIWGGGQQHGLGLSAGWRQGKGRPLMELRLPPRLLISCLTASEAAPTAPKIKP